jgi:hypothetical protein
LESFDKITRNTEHKVFRGGEPFEFHLLEKCNYTPGIKSLEVGKAQEE